MKVKNYEVFYTLGTVQHKTSRVYKGIGSARKDAKRVAINELVKNIYIVGSNEMAHECFKEVLRCSCPTNYHKMFVDCRGY